MGELYGDLFSAVFWIPLHLLNPHVETEGKLYRVTDAGIFFGRALAEFVLEQPQLEVSLCDLLKGPPEEILILLDGYDEASDQLRQAIHPFLGNSTYHFILTSRPGLTDLIEDRFHRKVHILGFTDSQIVKYCSRFFSRRNNNEVNSSCSDLFLEKLKMNSYLYQMAHNPLLLQMLCSL
jgi:hypothetical protein